MSLYNILCYNEVTDK